MPSPGVPGGFDHLNNLKFKSFENVADRREVVPGGKQIFTVFLIYARERLIDVVHRRRAPFFLREKHGCVVPSSLHPLCTDARRYLRSRYAMSECTGFLLLYVSLNINTRVEIFAKPALKRRDTVCL